MSIGDQLCFWLCRALVAATPRRAVPFLAHRAADLWRWAGSAQRRAALDHLRVILPAADKRELRRLAALRFRYAALELAELFRPSGSLPLRGPTRLEGEAHLHELLRAGKGALFCGAHAGGWELAGEAVAGLGVKVAALVQPHLDVEVEALLVSARAARGITTIHAHQVKKALRALRRGEFVCLLGDRAYGAPTVTVEWFSRPVPLPIGPARLALAAGVPFVPFWTYRPAGEAPLVLQIGPPVAPRETPQAMVRHWAAWLEPRLASAPEQWRIFGPYFAPAGPQATPDRAGPPLMFEPSPCSPGVVAAGASWRPHPAAAKVCAVIPAFNEQARLGEVVRGALRHLATVIVVDDGSADRTAEVARQAGAIVVRHARNRGKGEALKSGFRLAHERGFAAVVTLDGDGQHDPEQIPCFLQAYDRAGCDLVVGYRANSVPMPLLRRWTNRVMTWMISQLAGRKLRDTQSGFRLVRTGLWFQVAPKGSRFELESEFLIRACRAGVRLRHVEIRTIYNGARSHIRPLADTLRFAASYLRLALPSGQSAAAELLPPGSDGSDAEYPAGPRADAGTPAHTRQST